MKPDEAYISTKPTDDDGFWIDMSGVEYSSDRKKLKKCHNRNINFYSIPEGVEVICDNAFYDNLYIFKLELPNSITAIGRHSFGQCFGLMELELPGGIRHIEESAFTGCSLKIALNPACEHYRVIDDLLYTADLSKLLYCPRDKVWVGLPGRLKRIGDYAFCFCDDLSHVYLPNGLTSIGVAAFRGCGKLENMELPKSVERIESRCFADCESLTELTLNEGLKSIGWNILGRQISLFRIDHIDLPSSLSDIEEGAFAYYEGTISIRPGNKHFVIKDGLLYTADLSTVLHCHKQASTVNLLPQLKIIGESAFSCCNQITEIQLPSGLKSICATAFSGCHYLSSIALPASLTKIEYRAFWECKSLKSITLPGDLTEMGESPFEDCPPLTVYCEYDPFERFPGKFPSGSVWEMWKE